ncbi:MAG: phosphopantetheine-binding protein, partial [Myxococcota bacterium]
YRTGDRARWTADGALEFLGRVDHQVKLRGVRIEPGEIEHLLVAHAGVRSALVMVREDVPGDQRLVAYAVLDPRSTSAKPPSSTELNSYLRGQVPGSMVPSAIVILDEFPHTPNGKIARAALPPPAGDRAEPDHTGPRSGAPGREPTLPRNQAERRLAEIWASALGLEQVGVHDNFFDQGGHSLLMVQVHGRIQTAFEREVPLVKLFEYPTISALAAYLSSGQDAATAQSAQSSESQRERGRRQREMLMRRRRRGKPRSAP